MRTLVIEGMDCAGKSTLIKRIKEQYPEAKSIHFPTKEWKKEEPVTDFMAKDMRQIFDVQDTDILLLDRFWPSTMVYQFLPMWKEKSISWAVKWSSMVSFIENILPIDAYILCTVSFDDWMERLDEESKDVLRTEFTNVVDTSQPREVWGLLKSAYDSLVTANNKWIRVDTNVLSDQAIKNLMEKI